MTQEEKAREIASSLWSGNEMNGEIIRGIAILAAIKMAEWKEEQIIEKAIEWLENNIIGMMDDDLPYIQSTHDVSKNEFIEDFKQALKEE